MPIPEDKIDNTSQTAEDFSPNNSKNTNLTSEANTKQDYSPDFSLVEKASADHNTPLEAATEPTNFNQDFTNLAMQSDGTSKTDIPHTDIPNTSIPSIDDSKTSSKAKNNENLFANLFEICSKFALPIIFLLLAFLVLQQLYAPRDLWYSDEVRHADVYTNMIENQDYLALKINGDKYPDKPPLYFWFMAGIEKYTGVQAEQLFFLALVISTFLFIFASWSLARLSGQDKRVSFAACLILLTCPYFIGLTHYARMDMLFAACIVASHFCLFKGFSKPRAYLWISSGFILAALATLIKGPYGAIMPLLSIIVYLVSKGSFKRAGAKDGAFGFALMLIIILAWVCALILTGNRDYISIIATEQVIGRASNAWHHANNWYYYLIWLPIVFIPYIFVVLFINWKGFLLSVPSKIKQRKMQISDGTRFIVLALVANFIMVSLVSTKIAIYLLPLFPFIAILLAKALLSLSERASRYFYNLLSGVYLLVSAVFAIVALAPYIIPKLSPEYLLKLPSNTDVYLAKASGFGISAALFLLLALFILFIVNKKKAQGAILANCLGLLICIQPLILVTAPSLSPLISPKKAALMLSNYAHEGYSIASYKLYKGVLSYYAQQIIPNIDEPEALKTWIDNNQNVAIFMAEKRYQELGDLDLDLIDKYFMAERFYVLLARSKADLNKSAFDTLETDNIIELPKVELPTELPKSLEYPNNPELQKDSEPAPNLDLDTSRQLPNLNELPELTELPETNELPVAPELTEPKSV